LENVHLSVTAMNLKSAYNRGESGHEQIVEDVNIMANIEKRTHLIQKRTVQRIIGEISKIHISLTEKQYGLVLEVYRQNLKESGAGASDQPTQTIPKRMKKVPSKEVCYRKKKYNDLFLFYFILLFIYIILYIYFFF